MPHTVLEHTGGKWLPSFVLAGLRAVSSAPSHCCWLVVALAQLRCTLHSWHPLLAQAPCSHSHCRQAVDFHPGQLDSSRPPKTNISKAETKSTARGMVLLTAVEPRRSPLVATSWLCLPFPWHSVILREKGLQKALGKSLLPPAFQLRVSQLTRTGLV